MHQLKPHFFADFFAVAEGVSEFADFDLPAVVLIENLEYLHDVGLSDKEESVGTIGQKLGEVYLPFS